MTKRLLMGYSNNDKKAFENGMNLTDPLSIFALGNMNKYDNADNALERSRILKDYADYLNHTATFAPDEATESDKPRILKGWTEEEQEIMHELRDDGNTLFEIFGEFSSGDSILHEKYFDIDDYDKNDSLARDIYDFYNSTAKFPDKKYYVHLVGNDYNTYLQLTDLNERRMGNKHSLSKKTIFTKEEALAIDPRLEPFLEEVPDEELED